MAATTYATAVKLPPEVEGAGAEAGVAAGGGVEAGGQAPSPGAQDAVAPCSASQAIAVSPAAAVVTEYVLSLHSAPQVDHVPTQLTAGHWPSPGEQAAVS